MKVFMMDNPDGSFNCFLNVVIQQLWRAEGFAPVQDALLALPESGDDVPCTLGRLFRKIA
jgi:hypothetical protein